MNNIKAIQRLNEEELRLGISGKASWHSEYQGSAYVFVGGIPFGMNEGDVSTVFSQCGEIVDCNIPRDSETGKSKGFAFIGYADQRSTVLAVDNFNGAFICGRAVKVDHVAQYKLPKEYRDQDNPVTFNPSGPDGKGWGEFKRLTKETLEEHNKVLCNSEELWEKQLMDKVRAENKPKDKKKKQEKHKKIDTERKLKKKI
jgi:RNA-binding motif X-linked protein 2